MIHHRLITASLVSLASIASAGSIQPPAGPIAPTMKTLQQVEPRLPLDQETAPGDADALMKITNPGSYYLTANMTASAGRALLEIAASDVTVDLNGFRIQGAAGSLDGVFTSGAAVNVVIRNGSLASFGGDGVDASSAKNVRLENLRVRSVGGVGLKLGAESIASECEVSGAGLHGVLLANRSELRDSTVSASGSDGVNAPGDSARVHHCTVLGNTGDGIEISGTNAAVTDCMVRENQSVGVSLAGGSTLRDSTVSSNAGSGVFMRARDRVSNCRISGNTNNGVSMTGAGVVENNQILENKIHGVSVFYTNGIRNADMVIRNNSIDGNGDTNGEYAIYCANGTFNGTIDNNTASMNRGGIKLVGTYFSVTRNVIGPNYYVPFDFDSSEQDAAPVAASAAQATHPLANIDNGTFIVGQ